MDSLYESNKLEQLAQVLKDVTEEVLTDTSNVVMYLDSFDTMWVYMKDIYYAVGDNYATAVTAKEISLKQNKSLGRVLKVLKALVSIGLILKEPGLYAHQKVFYKTTGQLQPKQIKERKSKASCSVARMLKDRKQREWVFSIFAMYEKLKEEGCTHVEAINRTGAAFSIPPAKAFRCIKYLQKRL